MVPRVTKDGETKHLPYTRKGLAQAKAAQKAGATVAYGPAKAKAKAKAKATGGTGGGMAAAPKAKRPY